VVRGNGFGEDKTIWNEIREYWLRKTGNGGSRGFRLWPIIIIIILAIWIAAGIYTVEPGDWCSFTFWERSRSVRAWSEISFTRTN
jgi:hypothetical protein